MARYAHLYTRTLVAIVGVHDVAVLVRSFFSTLAELAPEQQQQHQRHQRQL